MDAKTQKHKARDGAKMQGKDGMEEKKRHIFGMRKGTKMKRWREYEEWDGKIRENLKKVKKLR